MIVKEMVVEWLKAHGYDGLWHDQGCGCVIEDLMPCCSDTSMCEAGYRLPGDDDSPYYVGPVKPQEEVADGPKGRY